MAGDTEILVAIIGAVASAGVAIGTYFFTRNKEINASIRQEKTLRYDELIAALIALVRDVYRIERGNADKAQRDTISNFIKAYHRSSTYANDDVLEKCNDLVELMLSPKPEESDTKKLKDLFEDFKEHVVGVYKAIRFDINPKAKYSKMAVLWPEEDKSTEEVRKSTGSPIK